MKEKISKSALFFVGRIDPVEYVGVSQQRNGNVRNINHPLCGCATFVIQKSPFRYNRVVQATIKERKDDFMAKQTNSLAHTKWMCKYHIIFNPKYRRKIVYNQYKGASCEISVADFPWRTEETLQALVS